jgi:hypothetical protein
MNILASRSSARLEFVTTKDPDARISLPIGIIRQRDSLAVSISGNPLHLECSVSSGTSKGLVAILGPFFASLPVRLTGIAAIGTAFFGVSQLSPRPIPTVRVTVTTTVTTSAELSALAPLQSTNVDRLTTARSQQVGPYTYANAVRFSCSNPLSYLSFNELVYKVVGYATFDATFGVPDDAGNGTGNSATITFYKDGGPTRMGNSLTVALDAPAHIHLNLQETSQLEIYCTAANQNGGSGDDIDIAIVNGTLSK